MSVYLHDIPLEEARNTLQAELENLGIWKPLNSEIIDLDERAIGRVLAEGIWARISSPHYHASAMDGFAVRANETWGAEPGSPITLLDNLEEEPSFQYVDTGDPLPDGFNAVIPIENTEALDREGNITSEIRHPACIRIRAAVPPWSHIRLLGEDIVETQLVFSPNRIISPVDLGAIAAAGYSRIGVFRKPKVAILPTGTELVPIGSTLKVGDILEYNSLVLAGQVLEWGGEPTRFRISPDDLEIICNNVQKAANEHDLILINAGISAGAEDLTAQVVEKLGTLLVHGVAVRPGHPVILGLIKRTSRAKKSTGDNDKLEMVPLIGVPGYPVSAALTGEIFVEPLVAKLAGRRPSEPTMQSAVSTRKITSPAGDDDFIRVSLGKVGKKVLATPMSRGAGLINSLAHADGITHIPAGVQGLEAGSEISVRLICSPGDLERTILCIGSHDMTLDLLAQFLSTHDRKFSSANVGSQGGLIALGRGESHLAGSHLLDPVSGKYNIAAIHKYLAGMKVNVIGFVGREQGLMIHQGNPKRIKDLNDLEREEITFINRQRGSGTRVLLDYWLEKIGLSYSSVKGYDQEEYTHLSVAAAVASKRADCGLGIPAAAKSLKLDFIPLFKEDYQLIIPDEFMELQLLKPLFTVLKDLKFQREVKMMPGYDTSQMGQIIAAIH